MGKVKIAVLGAGNRGREAYGNYILKNSSDAEVVAVAEPDDERRKQFSIEHQIPLKKQFKDWQELLEKPKLADGLIIATLDHQHVEPALSAMDRGYKILLEKPIAPTWEETLKIYKKAQELNITILVAHVLRYTDFYQQLKELLQGKVIGDIRFVEHIENIGFYHFAHSYVRGNWRNIDVASPIILAKSCHDMDLLCWLLESRCQKMYSSGSLEYFIEENQPRGASDRCINCSVEDGCPYSACKIYLDENNTGWPVSVITNDLSYQGRYEALKTGPYGRCVFKCDNNVPDVQTVSMTFEGNIEVNFALTAFSKEINRTSKFFGTRGEIRADFEQGLIEILDFGGKKQLIHLENQAGGHGGGDSGLMRYFVRLLRGDIQSDKPGYLKTDIGVSIESHLMAFAAEKSRMEKRAEDLTGWRKKFL